MILHIGDQVYEPDPYDMLGGYQGYFSKVIVGVIDAASGIVKTYESGRQGNKERQENIHDLYVRDQDGYTSLRDIEVAFSA